MTSEQVAEAKALAKIGEPRTRRERLNSEVAKAPLYQTLPASKPVFPGIQR